VARVSVRHIVADVEAAIEFYCGLLGFIIDVRDALAGRDRGGSTSVAARRRSVAARCAPRSAPGAVARWRGGSFGRPGGGELGGAPGPACSRAPGVGRRGWHVAGGSGGHGRPLRSRSWRARV